MPWSHEQRLLKTRRVLTHTPPLATDALIEEEVLHHSTSSSSPVVMNSAVAAAMRVMLRVNAFLSGRCAVTLRFAATADAFMSPLRFTMFAGKCNREDEVRGCVVVRLAGTQVVCKARLVTSVFHLLWHVHHTCRLSLPLQEQSLKRDTHSLPIHQLTMLYDRE